MGTSSRQGKFTLQINLKREISSHGYNVGFIATEPSGYLFESDFVFPMGYNSTVDLNNNLYDYVSILNEELWKTEVSGKELIIVGSQSGSIHYDNSNLTQLAINPYVFIVMRLMKKKK